MNSEQNKKRQTVFIRQAGSSSGVTVKQHQMNQLDVKQTQTA